MPIYKDDDNLFVEDLKGVKAVHRILVWELEDSLERVQKGMKTLILFSGITYLPFIYNLLVNNDFNDFLFFECLLFANLFIILYFFPKGRKDLSLIIGLTLFFIWLILHQSLLFGAFRYGHFSLLIIQIAFYGVCLLRFCIGIYNYYKAEKARQKILMIIDDLR